MQEPIMVEKVVTINKNLPVDGEDFIESPTPDAIRITRLFGFYDEEQHLNQWFPGCVITDVSDIEMLIEHSAPYEIIEIEDDH